MKSIYFAPFVVGAFLFSACSPMPKPQYGFTSEYIHKEQDLSKMEVDIKVDNVFSTMYNCNKEILKRGEVGAVLFSLGMIPGVSGQIYGWKRTRMMNGKAQLNDVMGSRHL